MGLSPSSSHGNGGSQPAGATGFYWAVTGNGDISVPSGVDTALAWVFGAGTDLLKTTAPASPEIPTVLADGEYQFFGAIQYWGADQAGKYMTVSAEADVENWAAGPNISPIELDKHGAIAVSVAVMFPPWDMVAGTPVGWFIKHDAGVSLNFNAYGYLRRTTGITGTPLT